MTRFNRDGTPDRTWDGDAQAFAGFGSQSYGLAAALQPDRKVIVVGLDASEVDMAAARFRPDGSLDPSFDRLIGGGHRDRCTGGPGRDRGAGCEARRSL